jgi:hypothetical protein
MQEFSVDGAVVRIETHPNPAYITAHTNFNIDAHPGLRVSLSAVDGVEDADCHSKQKYSVSIMIGQAFSRDKVGQEVAASILRFIGKDYPSGPL